MQDAYDTPFDRYDTPVDVEEAAPHLEPRLDPLAAREGRTEVNEVKREAEAQIEARLRRECEERERRQWLADRRAALPEERLEALRRRTEKALATDGVSARVSSTTCW